jgi:hypothetical protein
MARLPYADISQRIPQLNIFKLLANAQTAFRPFMEYGLVLLRDLEVDPVVREQAILRVAALTPGAYVRALRPDPDPKGGASAR